MSTATGALSDRRETGHATQFSIPRDRGAPSPCAGTSKGRSLATRRNKASTFVVRRTRRPDTEIIVAFRRVYAPFLDGEPAQTACNVTYTILPPGSGQFGATIGVKNGGSSILRGWSLTGVSPTDRPSPAPGMEPYHRSGGNVTVREQTGQTWEPRPTVRTWLSPRARLQQPCDRGNLCRRGRIRVNPLCSLITTRK